MKHNFVENTLKYRPSLPGKQSSAVEGLGKANMSRRKGTPVM